MTEQELIEQLADKEHESWSNWMRYLFSKCEDNPDGSVAIPSDLVARWKDLAELPYSHLSEHSKQSDRDEVAHILPIIEAYKTDTPAILRQAILDPTITTPEKANEVAHAEIEAYIPKNEQHNKILAKED